MGRPFQFLVVLVFVAVVAAPGVLYMFGNRNLPIENRLQAPVPRLSVEKVLDTEMYGSITSYFKDHVPLRSQGVVADSWVDVHVFRDSPSELVLLGDDGWLFLSASVDFPCKNDASRDAIVRRIRRIDRLMEATGRRLVFSVSPNKEAIYPEHTGPFSERAKCARDSRAEIRPLLESSQLSHYVDMWAEMEALKMQSDSDVYFPLDSHWTWSGSLKLTERIVEELRPGLWNAEAVTATPNRPKVGGLSNLIGLPETDYSTFYEVDRGTVERLDQAPEDGPNEYSSTGVRVVEGETLVIHDSFGAPMEPLLNRYLAHSTWVHWRIANDAMLTARIADTDTLVIQTVERFTYGRLGNVWMNTPASVAAGLLDELPQHDLSLEDVTGRGFVLENGVLDLDGEGARIRWPMSVSTGDNDLYLIVDAATTDGSTVAVSTRQSNTSFAEGPSTRRQGLEGGRQLLAFDLSEHGRVAELEIRARRLTVYGAVVVTVNR